MENKSSVGIGKPSKRQAEILQFITAFRKKKGYAPSLSEIADNFDVSVPTIHQHVFYLKRKHLLTTEKGKKRSIQAMSINKSGVIEIPLMGLIAAGGPIEAIRDPRPIEVPRNMVSAGANFYALKVAGTSMIEDGIFDGDVVIVRDQQTVDDGEKAVAYLPDKDTVTLKRIYRDKNRIKLVPANKNMKPFYETKVEIQGKVVGILRKEI
jgi:SOS regulatory protein LexA